MPRSEGASLLLAIQHLAHLQFLFEGVQRRGKGSLHHTFGNQLELRETAASLQVVTTSVDNIEIFER